MGRTNLMIVQGGGPTAVFNASLAAIVAEAQGQPSVARILGARFGIQGLIGADIADLTEMTAADKEMLRQTPGAALGSSRYRPSEDELRNLVETLRGHDVGYLLFLGGNGTMRGAEIVGDYCRSAGLDVQVVGVPKTVDNDIAATDRCPGYASAARYLAASTRELGADVRSLPQPVTILETMGRSVGWLAAATVLAGGEEGDAPGLAPSLVYVPEVAFEAESFLTALDAIVRRNGWAVVVVAEGIRNRDGSMVYEVTDAAQSDPLKRPMTGGVAQHLAGVVSKALGIRCRSEKPGLLARASMALVSKQDIADAALVGRVAVQALVAGESGVMVALRPLGENGHRLVPLGEAAGIERRIPAGWLRDGAVPVTEEFCHYLRPLVGELDRHIAEFPAAEMRTGVDSR
jgi:ATP-dependent phosphofructokinase / diphosphate-dependent phosphofructokinase